MIRFIERIVDVAPLTSPITCYFMLRNRSYIEGGDRIEEDDETGESEQWPVPELYWVN